MSRLWKLKNADGITMLLVRGCWGPGAGASKGPRGSPVLAALALGFCKFLRGASEPESCRGGEEPWREEGDDKGVGGLCDLWFMSRDLKTQIGFPLIVQRLIIQRLPTEMNA